MTEIKKTITEEGEEILGMICVVFLASPFLIIFVPIAVIFKALSFIVGCISRAIKFFKKVGK